MVSEIFQKTNYVEIEKDDFLIIQGLQHLTLHNAELCIRGGLFSDNCKPVHALRADMVVQGEDTAITERIQRARGVRG